MSEYHEKINALPLKDYFLSADEKGMSSIIEKTMVDKPDFDNPTELTAQLDNGVRQFIRDIEKTFLKNPFIAIKVTGMGLKVDEISSDSF